MKKPFRPSCCQLGLILSYIWTMSVCAYEGDFDRELTIFSPKGRLYQVEYAIAAVSNYGASCVAIKGPDFCVAGAIKNTPDELVEKDSVSHIHQISEDIVCLISGHEGDCAAAAAALRAAAARHARELGAPPAAAALARRAADRAQARTQNASQRPLGCSILLMSVDNEFGPQLLKIEPTGQFLHCRGMCIGKGEERATAHLSSKIKYFGGLGHAKPESGHAAPITQNDAIKIVLECLKQAADETAEDQASSRGGSNRRKRDQVKLQVDDVEVIVVSHLESTKASDDHSKDQDTYSTHSSSSRRRSKTSRLLSKTELVAHLKNI